MKGGGAEGVSLLRGPGACPPGKKIQLSVRFVPSI